MAAPLKCNNSNREAYGHSAKQLTITAVLPNTNRVEMNCGKVTDLCILIIADEQKIIEKSFNFPKSGAQVKSCSGPKFQKWRSLVC